MHWLVTQRASSEATNATTSAMSAGWPNPPGCLVISAATNCTRQSADVADLLRKRRNANVAGLEQRIAADVEAGAMPAGTDARALAVFIAAVLQGMSQQARDGATRDELRAVADAAMRAWPT